MKTESFRINSESKEKKKIIRMDREEQSENSLHTIAIILLCCGAVKMLHLLGVITVEGESLYYHPPLSQPTKSECFHCCWAVNQQSECYSFSQDAKKKKKQG